LSKVTWWLAALNGGAVFVLGAARLGWPSADFWTDSQSPLLYALLCTAAVPVVQATIAQRAQRSRAKELQRQRDVETCLTSSLVYCVNHGGAKWLDIGVQAFVVAGRWPRGQRQERIAKARLRPVASSGVSWEKGKGMIGRCWETHAQQYADLETHFAPYEHLDKEAWEALPAALRYSLSYEDFQHLKGKYGVIAAVPIMDRKDRYVGCVTADTAPRAGEPQTLIKSEILGSLASAAELVAGVLER
jgi:hypothetical protein